jgi:thiol:disulfide interchange protein
MRKFFYAVVFSMCAFIALGDTNSNLKVVCEGEMCYLVEEDKPAMAGAGLTSDIKPSRIAHGYMEERAFLDFLSGAGNSSASFDFSSMGIALSILAVLLGGLAMNLTPCVLPMIPVNLMIIGKSARRAAVYGLGMMLAYGLLGLAAALGGLAFGVIQSSPWFNLAVAVVFLVLSISLGGGLRIDFSKHRTAFVSAKGAGDVYAFLMGAVSAALAGACVAPVLIAVLLFTADLYAKGNLFALALPFVMGLGMALPWPIAGAGMKILPKPGAWMKWVNRIFALIIFAFALFYARLSYMGFAKPSSSPASGESDALYMTCDNFSLEGLKRPVLVDCWASWCKNCSAMDAVLSRPKVSQELRKFTFIKLQAEDISKLIKMPGFTMIKGLPAFVVFE